MTLAADPRGCTPIFWKVPLEVADVWINSKSLMVLMVPKPGERKQVFFTTASMPFGCAASVFSFSRITRSLLHLMQTLLGVIGGVFYDDFALLEPSASARMCSMASESFLEILERKRRFPKRKRRPFRGCSTMPVVSFWAAVAG